VGKRYEGGGWWDLSYRHLEFPDIDREGEFFFPATVDEIEDNKQDEIALGGSTWASTNTRLHSEVSVWDDEDESGGSAELGLDFPAFFLKDGRADLTLFGTEGQFSRVSGLRLLYTDVTEDGAWTAFYEVANHRQHDFSSAVNDLMQHRFGGRVRAEDFLRALTCDSSRSPGRTSCSSSASLSWRPASSRTAAAAPAIAGGPVSAR
jgi:hypothetical protein